MTSVISTHKRMHLLLFIFVFCFFLSCEKDDLQEEITTEIQEYSVEDFVLRTVDGHLVFENEKQIVENGKLWKMSENPENR